MGGFSAASATSICGTVSHRALSVIVEIEQVLKQGPAESPRFRNLLFFITKLQQFRQHVDQLQHCLLDSSVISPNLQAALSSSMTDCDLATAVLVKQMSSALPQNATRLNLQVLLKFEELLVSYSRLFIFIMQLVSVPDPVSQDSKLSSADGQQLVNNARASAAIIMSGVDLLDTRVDPTSGESSNSVLPEGTFSSTIVETVSWPSDELSAISQRTRKASLAKSLSSLTSTVKAMTAFARTQPEPFVSPLCQAAARGNIAQVAGLLNQGANINGRNEEGNTPLLCAISSNQSETAIFLIEAGADVCVRDATKKRRPPLFHALEVDDLKVADCLLQHGAKANDRNLVGQPYFVDVALGDRLEATGLCLRYGADARARDITGRSIICQATSRGNVALVRLLLEHNADPNDRDLLGNTLLHATIRNTRIPEPDRMALVRLLLEHGAAPDDPDTWGLTPLAHAAAADNLDLLNALLDAGADPNRPVHGDSLLVNAITRARWDQVWALVDRGAADPNLADARGRTPLRAAMLSQNPDVVQLLLRRGGRPE